MQKTFVLALVALLGLLAIASVALVGESQRAVNGRVLLGRNDRKGPLDEALKEARKDLLGSEDAREEILDELSELMAEGVERERESYSSSDRSSRESSYSESDASSWGHHDADKHARRVPIFEAALEAGRGKPVEIMRDAIEATVNDCENNDDDEEAFYCRRAVTCVALNSVTAHWKWLHLIDSQCQKVLNQFRGGRNKKNFNPEDMSELRDLRSELDQVDEDESALTALAYLETKYRVGCANSDLRESEDELFDRDEICQQKISCHLSAGLAEEFPEYVKVVRCPYTIFKTDTSSSSEDSSSSSSDDRHPSSSSSSSSS